jgi:hypothetical protein
MARSGTVSPRALRTLIRNTPLFFGLFPSDGGFQERMVHR